MFVLSKIFLFVINPGVWVPGLLLIGVALLWTRWSRTGRRLLTGLTVFLLLIAVVPLGQTIIAPLENRFPTVEKIDGPVNGIIVLGGTVVQSLTLDRGQPALSDGAERLTEFVKLARAYPHARLIFTGGSGSILRQDLKEADTARQFLQEMGLDTGRVTFEADARNTMENALFSYRLMQPAANERWLLVTSASHMPRAMGVFRKAGWQPTAYPVDYKTFRHYDWSPGFNLTGGLGTLGDGLYEWLGLAIYRLLGRSEEFFPGPRHRAHKAQ